MKKTFLGIALFMVQLGIALVFNQTIDLIVAAVLASLVCIALISKFWKAKIG